MPCTSAVAAIIASRSGEGAVVNLLDQKLWNPNPDFLSYTLSKAGLESATTLLALALAPAVRVVGVAPGLTLTSEWLQGEQFQQAHTLSPLGRSSTPQDVAATVAFVLANRSITGTTLLTQLALQAMANIAVVTALVPPKGVPHPFISYGGTNLLVSLVAIGLILGPAEQHTSSTDIQSNR